MSIPAMVLQIKPDYNLDQILRVNVFGADSLEMHGNIGEAITIYVIRANGEREEYYAELLNIHMYQIPAVSETYEHLPR